MAATTHITAGTSLFNPEDTKEVFSRVSGFSSLATIAKQMPIPFAGTDVFTFSSSDEAGIVGEGESKPIQNGKVGKVTIKPVKIVYQYRITDEFLNMSQEKQIPYLDAFYEAMAKKMARALDIMAMHGVDPKTKTASTQIGTNKLDDTTTDTGVTSITMSTKPDEDLESAINAILENDRNVTGIVMSPAFSAEMGKIRDKSDSNVRLYPELAFGGRPKSFAGNDLSINNTVSYNASTTTNALNPVAYVGDFADAFRWGYADTIRTEIIEFGNPDGQGDLKATNEIVIRAEAYIGWGILDKGSFRRIVKKVTAS